MTWKLLSIDINECLVGTAVCHADGTCYNEKGSYKCICNHGYSGSGKVCTGRSSIFLWDTSVLVKRFV